MINKKVLITALVAIAGYLGYKRVQADKAEQAALRAEFYAVAEERLAEVERTGLTVSREDMHAYVTALVAGDKPAPPKARKLPR